MADDLDDVFDDVEGGEPEAFVEPAPEAVRTDLEPEPQSEPAPEPTEPEQPTVPLSALHGERERRQALERELADTRAAQAQQVQRQNIPDALDDPDGFNAWNQQQIQAATEKVKLDISWSMATQGGNEATVFEARNWAVERANADPAFKFQLEQAIQSQPHPFDWIVRQHKQSVEIEEYGKDPVAFARKVLAQHSQPIAPVAVAALPVAKSQQAAPPARVPRSLATQGSGPSDIREIATGPLSAVDAVFPL